MVFSQIILFQTALKVQISMSDILVELAIWEKILKTTIRVK